MDGFGWVWDIVGVVVSNSLSSSKTKTVSRQLVDKETNENSLPSSLLRSTSSPPQYHSEGFTSHLDEEEGVWVGEDGCGLCIIGPRR